MSGHWECIANGEALCWLLVCGALVFGFVLGWRFPR